MSTTAAAAPAKAAPKADSGSSTTNPPPPSAAGGAIIEQEEQGQHGSGEDVKQELAGLRRQVVAQGEEIAALHKKLEPLKVRRKAWVGRRGVLECVGVWRGCAGVMSRAAVVGGAAISIGSIDPIQRSIDRPVLP